MHLVSIRKIVLALGAATVCLTITSFGAEPQTGQTAQTFERQITRTVHGQYLLYLPKEYGKDKGKHWPLILFLHGSGERGEDIEKVKIHGPPKLVANGKEFPFIIVSPQCPPNEGWSPEMLGALLDQVEMKYAVDKERLYVTGLSMGGFGTWNLACEFPKRFAAIAPICGGGDPRKAERIKHLPVWVFHGAKDQAVKIEKAQEMVDALKAAGGNVEFTIYPDAEHDSWSATYDNSKLYEWFLEHKRGQPASAKPTATPKN